MTTTRTAQPRRHLTPFRKDATTMYHIEIRLEEALQRQSLLRSFREQGRPGFEPGRPIRHRLGHSLVRLGRRVGGDAMTTPAWQR